MLRLAAACDVGMKYAQLCQQSADGLIKEVERDLQLQPRNEECLLRAECALRNMSRFQENTKPDLKLITGLRQQQAVHAETNPQYGHALQTQLASARGSLTTSLINYLAECAYQIDKAAGVKWSNLPHAVQVWMAPACAGQLHLDAQDCKFCEAVA